MRGWTIVVLVVIGGWFLIVGPPAILEPTVRAVPDQIYALIGWLYFSVFALPGRWVLLHIIEETARHAGHADIVRESIDGATMHPLMAAVEGWPATEWLTPWAPAS